MPADEEKSARRPSTRLFRKRVEFCPESLSSCPMVRATVPNIAWAMILPAPRALMNRAPNLSFSRIAPKAVLLAFGNAGGTAPFAQSGERAPRFCSLFSRVMRFLESHQCATLTSIDQLIAGSRRVYTSSPRKRTSSCSMPTAVHAAKRWQVAKVRW